MVDIYELMEFAEKEFKKRVPEDWETDDWMWNDTAFQFVIIRGRNIISDPYRFCYDEDEEFYGTAEEQVIRWLDRWFY